MKNFKYLLILLVFILFTSCNDNPKKVISAVKTDQAPNYQKMEFQIKGMTCEIGCARLIESKLAKTKGVKYSKVSFLDSLGMVEYDTNQLSKKEINSIVDDIADGKLYKSYNNNIVNEFKIKK